MRMTKRSTMMLCGVAAATLLPASAQAQSAPPPANTQATNDQRDGDATATGPDIVITAQKRDERLLNVPVSVTAVDTRALTAQNLVRLQDYASRVPGLSVPGTTITSISLRGITTGGGTNPTVAVTIDDIPINATGRVASNFPDLDPSDLQRVEVLRGPQGTLYGAASLGGLIKMVTTAPDPTRFSGRFEAGTSSIYNGDVGYVARGAINIPVWRDKIAIRASAFRRDDAPYIDNINPLVNQKDANKRRTEGTRIALLVKPTDNFTITLARLDQTVTGRNSGPVQITGFPTDYKPVRGYNVTNVGPQIAQDKTRLYSAKIEYDFGGVALTSVSGWGRLSTFNDSDLTTTFPYVLGAIPGFPIPTPLFPGAPAGSTVRLKDGNVLNKFSQEVRLSSTGIGAFQWILGGFYTNERVVVDQNLQAFAPTGTLFADVGDFPVPSTFKEKAVFLDVTYKFTDRFDVQVGGRYSKNDQTVRQDQTVAAAAVPLFGPTRLGTLVKASDDSFTWLVTPRFKINDSVMIFARVASGYRPGGPNLQAASSLPFKPDRVVNYELGTKGTLFSRTLTFDMSLFDIEWSDVQLQNTAPSNLAFLTNGGKARSRGFEGALTWAPGDGWSFNGNMTITDATLTSTIPTPTSGAALIGGPGTRLPYSPKFTSNLGGSKSFRVTDDLKFTVGANWTHIGDRNSALRSTTAPVARRGAVIIPSYNLVDANATFGYKGFNLSFYVRNLFNEHGILNIDDRQGAVTTTNATFVQPRSVGVVGSFAF